jgi:sterol desaturase/sphingolipid hydroxylase (fatty acid hydroxylase superfamily)
VTVFLSNQLGWEMAIRLVAAATVFAAMALAEGALPRRERSFSRWARWPANVGIVAINNLALRIVVPITAVGAALAAAHRGSGLLNRVALPGAIAFGIAVIALDLAIYLQHRVFHAIPLLWRIHRTHHADLDFDLTTGLRFHPVEIIISMFIKVGVVFAIGASAAAVLVFEVLLNGTSMFNHGNLEISEAADRWLRWVLVTPDMHRVHHSIVRTETNSNFGFNLPWWDYLMRTYCAQPAAGHLAMTIGTDQFRSIEELKLMPMLTQPLRGEVGGYPNWTNLLR